MYCYVRDCPNGLKSKKKKDSDLIKYFSAPEDKNLLEKWRRIIPSGETVFSTKDKLCDSHFLPSEVVWFTETKLPNGNVRRLLRDEPILKPGTIPSIFPAEKLEKEITLQGKEKETPKSYVKSASGVSVKEKLVTPKSIVKNSNAVVKEKFETPKSNFRIRFKDPVESSAKRNPQRTKRRSTVLDDYFTDEELNQVHNQGASKAATGSGKKRKTETGLQPVIRLVPLECLMDKTVSKSKTVSKVLVGNRRSTEEIDLELKKVIEIPLLTRFKPNKPTTIRSTKETVQFKPPKKNVSKPKMKILSHSEVLIVNDAVPDCPEVKTETPDIEEELARMEMEEENEDVKSSDIVVMNPASLGDDDSVTVKSEEEDDSYSVNEVTQIPSLNTLEGDEIPTIKSESEEEQPVAEVDSVSTSDNEFASNSQSTHVPESEAPVVIEPGSSMPLPTENSDGSPIIDEQPKELPEVPAQEVEQNEEDVDKHRNNEAEVPEKTTTIEAENADNTSCAKVTEEGEVSKIAEDKDEGQVERVLENEEQDKTAESGKEVEEGISTAAAGEVTPEETQLPKNSEEISKPVENEEIPQSVETEASQNADEGIKDTIEDGKHCEATVDESRSNDVNTDLPEVANVTDGDRVNETENGETAVTDSTINNEPSKPDDNLDTGVAGELEAIKEPSSEAHRKADSIVDVDLLEVDDPSSSSKDTPVEPSSASQEVEPKKTDEESTMEVEHGKDTVEVQSPEDIADDVVHLDASPAAADDEVVEAEKDAESKKKDTKQTEQTGINEEMDIEAEVARLVSEVEETATESPSKEVGNDGGEGATTDSTQRKRKNSDKEKAAKDASKPQEIVLQDTANLGGITAAGVQNLFSPETIQEILKQIKLPLTTPVTFRIAPASNTSPSSSTPGRGRGRKKGMRGMRGTNRPVISRASSSRDMSHDSIDLFRQLTRTRTVFDFPTFVPDIDDDVHYWKLCQILKESFHELIETRNTKTSIGKLTLRVALNRPKKPIVEQNNRESEADPQ